MQNNPQIRRNNDGKIGILITTNHKSLTYKPNTKLMIKIFIDFLTLSPNPHHCNSVRSRSVVTADHQEPTFAWLMMAVISQLTQKADYQRHSHSQDQYTLSRPQVTLFKDNTMLDKKYMLLHDIHVYVDNFYVFKGSSKLCEHPS